MIPLDFFPHESTRSGQQQLLEDIYATINKAGLLLAHAPTGLGKTASALSMCVAVAKEKKKTVLFLTSRHTQHAIAVETLQLMKKKGIDVTSVDLIGKRWMCNQEVANLYGSEFREFCKTVVEKGECEYYNNIRQKGEETVPALLALKKLQEEGPINTHQLKAFCQARSMCSYEMALLLAKKANVIIGDYNHLFHPYVQKTLLLKINKELEDLIVIVDEGHNLAGRVTEMISHTLTTSMIRYAIIEAQKFRYQGVINWLEALKEVLEDVTQDKKERLVNKQEFVSLVNSITSYDDLIEELTTAADEVRKKQRKSSLGGIAAFLDAWRGEDAGFTRIITQNESYTGTTISLNYSCLDPSIITKPVFDQVFASVVMSGTLQPLPMYRDLFGIPHAQIKAYPSPFPVENRLCLVIPETSTKYTQRSDTMYKRIATICAQSIERIPGNVALFFPSYALRDKICELLSCSKQLFWEQQQMNTEQKEQVLKQFAANKAQGGVLLGVSGGNFSEGIDFPGDLLHGVIIVGLPLARPDLKVKETIRYFDERFSKGWAYGYTYPAMNKCMQSAGRCIRSETDKGVVIFLDERFAWEQYFSCLPRTGTLVTRKYNEQLTSFFDKKAP